MKIDLIKTNATKRTIDVSPKLNVSGIYIFKYTKHYFVNIKLKVFIVSVISRFW